MVFRLEATPTAGAWNRLKRLGRNETKVRLEWQEQVMVINDIAIKVCLK